MMRTWHHFDWNVVKWRNLNYAYWNSLKILLYSAFGFASEGVPLEHCGRNDDLSLTITLAPWFFVKTEFAE